MGSLGTGNVLLRQERSMWRLVRLSAAIFRSRERISTSIRGVGGFLILGNQSYRFRPFFRETSYATEQKIISATRKSPNRYENRNEIEEWIIKNIQESKVKTVIQFEETKLTPMHQEIRNRFSEIDNRFVFLESKMDLRFSTLTQSI